ncbi:CapA family protein, partial [bacterium]|nr:CapA family protein [bacterium]
MTAETTRPVILRAVGDVALVGRSARSLVQGSDPTWQRTAEFLSDADITFANFEMPIATSSVQPAAADVSNEFLGVPASLPEFLLAGVDVAALATNHMMDWGERGLLETIEQLRERGVRVVGAGRNLDEALRGVVLERGGLRIGFVAFTPSQRWTATKSKPGCAPLKLEFVRQALDSLSGADVKIVSLHWGLEVS